MHALQVQSRQADKCDSQNCCSFVRQPDSLSILIEGDENDLVKGHRGQYLRMKQETETERQRQNEFVKYLLSL